MFSTTSERWSDKWRWVTPAERKQAEMQQSLSLSRTLPDRMHTQCTRASEQVTQTLQVVEVWVLGHAAVEEGPREVVHCILLVLHRLGHHLRVEVVVHEVVQMRLQWMEQEQDKNSSFFPESKKKFMHVNYLNRERLIEELLVEFLLGALAQQDGHT